MSVPAEPVPEWCWRSSNFQHLLISWTCHFLWQTRRSLLGLGRHVHIGGVGWQVSHNLLLSDLGPSTHEEPTLEQPPVPLGSVLALCLHWLGQVMAQITGQWTSVLDLCCWNIPSNTQSFSCINQCNDECVLSGEPLLCALPDLKKFPNVVSPYQLQRNPSKQRLDQDLSVLGSYFLKFSFFSRKKKPQNLPRFGRFDVMDSSYVLTEAF